MEARVEAEAEAEATDGEGEVELEEEYATGEIGLRLGSSVGDTDGDNLRQREPSNREKSKKENK